MSPSNSSQEALLLKKGWLLKRGRWRGLVAANQSWDRRYVLVYANPEPEICYFRREGEACADLRRLLGCHVEAILSKTGKPPYAFRVAFASGFEYVLGTGTEKDRSEWVLLLRQCAQQQSVGGVGATEPPSHLLPSVGSPSDAASSSLPPASPNGRRSPACYLPPRPYPTTPTKHEAPSPSPRSVSAAPTERGRPRSDHSVAGLIPHSSPQRSSSSPSSWPMTPQSPGHDAGSSAASPMRRGNSSSIVCDDGMQIVFEGATPLLLNSRPGAAPRAGGGSFGSADACGLWTGPSWASFTPLGGEEESLSDWGHEELEQLAGELRLLLGNVKQASELQQEEYDRARLYVSKNPQLFDVVSEALQAIQQQVEADLGRGGVPEVVPDVAALRAEYIRCVDTISVRSGLRWTDHPGFQSPKAMVASILAEMEVDQLAELRMYLDCNASPAWKAAFMRLGGPAALATGIRECARRIQLQVLQGDVPAESEYEVVSEAVHVVGCLRNDPRTLPCLMESTALLQALLMLLGTHDDAQNCCLVLETITVVLCHSPEQFCSLMQVVVGRRADAELAAIRTALKQPSQLPNGPAVPAAASLHLPNGCTAPAPSATQQLRENSPAAAPAASEQPPAARSPSSSAHSVEEAITCAVSVPVSTAVLEAAGGGRGGAAAGLEFMSKVVGLLRPRSWRKSVDGGGACLDDQVVEFALTFLQLALASPLLPRCTLAVLKVAVGPAAPPGPHAALLKVVTARVLQREGLEITLKELEEFYIDTKHHQVHVKIADLRAAVRAVEKEVGDALQEARAQDRPSAGPPAALKKRAPPPPPPQRRPPPPPPPKGRAAAKKAAAAPPVPAAEAGPKPGRKMKSLFWEKIPGNRTAGTFWESHGAVDWLDLAEAERLFHQVVRVAKTVTKERKARRLLVLDLQRANAIGIRMSRFLSRLPLEQVPAAVERLDLQVFRCEEDVRMVLACVPSDDEWRLFEQIRARPDAPPVEQLAEPERLCLGLMQLPRVRPRLATFQATFTAEERLHDIRAAVQVHAAATAQVMECAELHATLRAVLALGNFLNWGTRLGGAAGFHLRILPKLGDTRAADGRGSLLAFLAQALHKQGVADLALRLPALQQHLPLLKEQPLGDLEERLQSVSTDLAGMQQELEACASSGTLVQCRVAVQGGRAVVELAVHRYVEVVGAAHARLAAELDRTCREAGECRRRFEAAAAYFGEGHGSGRDNFWHDLGKFVADVSAAQRAVPEACQDREQRPRRFLARSDSSGGWESGSGPLPQPRKDLRLGSGFPKHDSKGNVVQEAEEQQQQQQQP